MKTTTPSRTKTSLARASAARVAHMARRLTALAESLTPSQIEAGRLWYINAGLEAWTLARRYTIPERAAAGVIAALSPRARWPVNLTWADRLIGAWRRNPLNPDCPVSWTRNRDKAYAILNGCDPLECLIGPKVLPFFRAIMGDTSAIVIDGWMAVAATGREPLGGGLWPRQVKEITQAFRRAALALDHSHLSPRDLQAALWTQTRDHYATQGGRFQAHDYYPAPAAPTTERKRQRAPK